MTINLNDKLSSAPNDPGVYLMKDSEGKVIYVGKARDLKKRLSSYFKQSGQIDLKTGVLVKNVSSFDTIITRTEKEALILESNLIKRYKPRYNVILKDDKRYPSLRLDIKSQYPNLNIVRKIEKNGAQYFGPFSSSQAVRQTLKIIHKTFKLRKCKTKNFKKRLRPCLNYQIDACFAPCCLDVDNKTYNEIVKEVVLFLKGRTPELIKKIKKQMTSAAKDQDYERAAVFRDKIFALEKMLEKQVAVTTDFKDRDVIAIADSPEISLLSLLFVRGGYLLGKRCFSFTKTMSTKAEMVGAFIRQYYEKTHFVPQEVLVPIPLEDTCLLEDWLTTINQKKVRILYPRRGEKAQLIKMAVHNAQNSLKDLIASTAAEIDISVRLQKRLRMDKMPERIECFDNSNISGTEPVAGMVVFENGKPNKSLYRKYKIKTVNKQNDYAYMAEILTRRYGKGEKSKPYPDLLIVDGGKGHLNIALSIIKKFKLEKNFEIIGIAKKPARLAPACHCEARAGRLRSIAGRDVSRGETNDKVYQPGRANPVNFGREGDLLLFLQKIRDEAHRFAISFHRKRRNRKSMHSILDTVPGIGKKRKETLLKHFGSIDKIRQATIEELVSVPGISRKIAEALKLK
ncbi:MAG: excinuclease ABC subunit UvrC [Desulfobacteraceae bacterium]|nr:excinuclease ABC subunit UvrC [Pseudomonadota bacterium]MCG2758751.1 excinuclease ABC subunit UvrC [Desulfobacteraceae bacterium]